MKVAIKSVMACMKCPYSCMIEDMDNVTCGCDQPCQCDNVKHKLER